MRKITLIVVHCSAVPPGRQSSAADIDKWHKARKDRHGRPWKGIGYHFVIRRDGSVELGRPVAEVGAHCDGHNSHSIGICYEGGLDEHWEAADTRTPQQKAALRGMLTELHRQFPKALIVGHRDLNPDRDCPCFDVVEAYKDLEPPVGG